MTPLTITFEAADDPQYVFRHIWSTDGVLGHRAEVQERIPAGTWLTLPPAVYRLRPWLVKHCHFRFIARVLYEHEVLDVLVKE